MLSSHEKQLLRELRKRTELYLTQLEPLAYKDTGDPLGIQMIFTAVSDGYKSGLARALAFAKDEQEAVADYQDIIAAAEIALTVWAAFEEQHGNESLLDFQSRVGKYSMHLMGIETDTHAKQLIVNCGRAYRDSAVSFDYWTAPHHHPRPARSEALA